MKLTFNIVLCFTVALLLSLAVYLYFLSNGVVIKTVEIGLSETSPNGEQGGFAVPASGASSPSINAACNSYGNSVTLSWSASSDQYGHDHGGVSYIVSVDDISNPWNGTWGSATCSSMNPGDYCQQMSSLSWNLSITPNQTYRWGHLACSGGVCSSFRQSSFNCVSQVNLQALNLGYIGVLEDRQFITLTAQVRNSGSIDTLTGFTDRFRYRWGGAGSWTTVSTHNQAALNAGATSNDVSSSFELAGSGDIEVEYCVDSADVVSESSENDNCVTRVLNVAVLPPELTVDVPIVPSGDEVEISWDTGSTDPASCTLTGPGVNYAALPSVSGSITINPTSEQTYVIDCGPGGRHSVTVKVLPVIQET